MRTEETLSIICTFGLLGILLIFVYLGLVQLGDVSAAIPAVFVASIFGLLYLGI